MGYDAYVYIRKKYTKLSIEKLLILMGYEKKSKFFLLWPKNFTHEPINDLDIATLTVLGDYPDRFPGIVITVSHDRYFLDRTVRRIFAFEGAGRLNQYEGGYTDYAICKSVEREQPEAISKNKKGNSGAKEDDGKDRDNGEKASEKSWKTGPSKLKFTYQEQKDYDTIKAATDFIKLNELTKEKEETEQKLEEKMERWMYLEDLKARIDAQ